MPKADMGATTNRFSLAIWTGLHAIPYAARVLVWVRGFVRFVNAFELEIL